jgi:hypothetical protein
VGKGQETRELVPALEMIRHSALIEVVPTRSGRRSSGERRRRMCNEGPGRCIPAVFPSWVQEAGLPAALICPLSLAHSEADRLFP